ncbi:MAG TPA: XdhC family protein [Actinomycetota bacterium]|nr:XdhC family protein [Actinomycetota bacterium]
MSEIAEVLRAIESLSVRGERMALATIVGVQGSTYRRPGARLLVPEAGPMVGNISGGCLEGEVQAAARDVMDGGAPRLLTFDLTADDEAVWGWGLGCNGVIDVFVEPADRAAEVARTLRLALEEDRPIAHVTVLESAAAGVRPGSHMVVHPGGRREGTLGSPDDDLAFTHEAERAIQDGLSQVVAITPEEGEIRAFVEVLEPPPRVLVCGAGHDTIPAVRHAASLGWRVTVADDREAFLTADRFPEAAGFVHTEPDRLGRAIELDRRTYVVVMTHNFLRDLGYLRSLLGTEVAYIGMLGPRARLDRLLENLARDGVHPSEEDLAKIHGPAGLDVGAEGPEEIAAAIVAEMLAVQRGREAGFLRDRKGPIHGSSGER